MQRYNPKDIEPKWQTKWEEDGTYVVDLNDHSRPKYYGFSMLPGITGAGIHIGHGRTFQFSDIKVRVKRQQGFNAYHPIGWDSFGLPVENYAIKVGKKPREAHDEAKANFIKQLKRLGYSYDWSKEISTADPSYYKWTQWIFTQLYKNDLAYQKESPQWWCETDQTVLANEQVEGGKCWRCGNQVIKKNLKQWFFRITAYADEILEATDALDWTEMVKTMQKNWIGKSEGAEIEFKLDNHDESIKVFTTRPDTIYGATFMVLAPEHPLVYKITTREHKADVENYIQATQSKSDIERQETNRKKTGVATGAHVINPATGDKIPVWIADYVLMGYGTGAIMAVPALDERDGDFAEKYSLPISDAKLTDEQFGKQVVTYKMRDWLISRQRYWGAPIPIIHCQDHGAVAVPDDQLPVILPDVDDFKPKGGATSVLATIEDWVNVPCPTCGKPSKRETDTLDGYACSSWYWLRYADPFNDQQAWDPKGANYWQPVDFYNGADHAVAHLLYARFWTRFFYKQGLVPDPEPFKRMLYNAYILAPDGRKMSKSLGNVIDPIEIMDSGYGADSLRVYEMFIAPYDMDSPWDTRGVPGTYRFLSRVWALVQEYLESGDVALDDQASNDILVVAHKTIKKVTNDIEEDKFNTAVSSMMEAVNSYFKLKESHKIGKSGAWTFALESLLQVLAPFAPHITEELWSQLGHNTTIHKDNWPKHNEKYLVKDTIKLAVQVNGKLRGEVEVPADADEQSVLEAAKQVEKVAGYLEGQTIKKAIYVPGRLVSFVI